MLGLLLCFNWLQKEDIAACHLQFHLRAQPNELREYLVMVLCNLF